MVVFVMGDLDITNFCTHEALILSISL